MCVIGRTQGVTLTEGLYTRFAAPALDCVAPFAARALNALSLHAAASLSSTALYCFPSWVSWAAKYADEQGP